MKYPSDHKANTRQRLLDEATKAICTEGPDRTAIASVMGAAGLTVGAFYAHFKSKDDLISEAVDHMFEVRYATFLRRLDTPEPRKALTGFVDYYLSWQHREAIVGGCPIPTLAGHVPNFPKAARQRFLNAVDRITSGVADLLEAMGCKNASATSALAMAEMIGAVSLARLTVDRTRAEALLADARLSVSHKLGLVLDS